ncbi:hypothetical protein Tco_0575404 [Tanacetum coccineum]
MSPSMEARIAEYAVAPTPPSPPPSPLSPWSSLLPQIPSPPLPPPTLSLHLPPHVPTSLPLPSSPLPHYQPHWESSTAVPRPAGGHGIDYGIRDTWVDPREVVEKIAPVTLEGVNTRVTELAVMQEQDTQDIYVVIEDAQDRQTRIFQSFETLIDDRQYHYETARLTHAWMQDHRIDEHDSMIAALTAQVSSLQGHLTTTLGEIQALQARDQARADAPEDTANTAVGLVFSFLVLDNHNNMPPRRSSATARAAVARAAAATAATPMTVAAVE